MRFKRAVAAGAVIVALAACAKDSGTAKTDTAAADSIRAAHDAVVTDSSAAAAGVGSPTDSVQGPVNSTEGTIGETRNARKVPGRMQKPDTIGRDSVIHGPYKTMDSLGRIKR